MRPTAISMIPRDPRLTNAAMCCDAFGMKLNTRLTLADSAADAVSVLPIARSLDIVADRPMVAERTRANWRIFVATSDTEAVIAFRSTLLRVMLADVPAVVERIILTVRTLVADRLALALAASFSDRTRDRDAETVTAVAEIVRFSARIRDMVAVTVEDADRTI